MQVMDYRQYVLANVLKGFEESGDVARDLATGEYGDVSGGYALTGRYFRLRCESGIVVLEERRHIGWMWLCEFDS